MPAPTEALLQVSGKPVVIQLAVMWKAHQLRALAEKIRGISISFQDMRLSPSMSSKVVDAVKQSKSVDLQLNRNGRRYVVPAFVNSTNEKAVILSSNATYELGACFLDSWRTHIGTEAFESQGLEISEELRKLIRPRVQLVLDGKVAASAEVPKISWDPSGSVSRPRLDAHLYDGGENLPPQFGTIPRGVEMRDNTADMKFVGNV